MKFFQTIIQFIMVTTHKYSLDESHGIMHSFDTLHNAHKIYSEELKNFPEMETHEKIIYAAAALHDMCDKKYMNELEGIKQIDTLLENNMSELEISVVHDIVEKMSYSKVKTNGFPEMGKYQSAYNVVREADLLGAYDFNRAIVYSLYNKNDDIDEAYEETCQIFLNRMLKHEEDGLLTFDYTKKDAIEKKNHSLQQMKQWKKILKIMK